MAEELVIRIRAEDSTSDALAKIKAGIEGVTGSAGPAARGLEGFGKQTAAIAIGSAAGELAAKGLAGAFGLVDDAIKSALASGVERGSQLNDLSQRVGVSVEQLSRLELAAKTNGVGLEELGVGVQQLSRKMTEAAGGGKDAQAAFTAVGISVKDLKNLNTEQILDKIADSFSGANDGATKTAIAMDLLGRAGARMIPLFNEGSQGLQHWSDLSEKLGLTMSTQLAHSFDTIGDSVDTLKMAVTGAENQFAIGMAPALERVTAAVVDFVANAGIANGSLQSLGADFGDLIQSEVEPAIAALRQFIETAKLEGFGPAMEQALDAAGGALKDKGIEIGHVIGKAITDGTLETIVFDAEAIAAKIPVVGIVLKIKQAFSAAMGSVPWDAGSTPFAGIEQSWAKQESGIQRGVTALKSYDSELRTVGGAYVMMGGDAAVAAAAVGKHTLELNKGGGAAADLNKQLTEQAGKVAAESAIWAQAAQGTISYADAQIKVAAASKEAGKEGANAATALLALKTAQAEAVNTLEQSIAKQVAQTQATQAGTVAFQEVFAATGDVEKATQAAAAASEDYTIRALAAAAGNKAVGEEAVAAAEKLRQVTEAFKQTTQIANGQAQLDLLQKQLEIHKQIAAGVISQAEGERQLAIAAAGVNPELQAQAAKAYDLKKAIEDTDASVIHLGTTFKNSLSQVADALISGTLKFGDAAKSFGLAMGKQWVEGMLDSKLRDFDPQVQANFLDLGSFGKETFSKLFSSDSGSTGSSGQGLFKQAEDWIGGLLKGASNGGSSDWTGVGSAGFTGAAAGDYANGAPYGSIPTDFGGAGGGPSNYVSMGSQGPDLGGGGGGGGFSGAGALAGAASGYASAGYFGKMLITDTGLPSSLKQVQDQTLNRLRGMNEVVSTILGAVFGGLAGGGGAGGGIIGTVFGAFDSLVGATWGDRVNRDVLRNRGFGGGGIGKWTPPIAGGFDGGSWDVVGATDPLAAFVMNTILSLPTLGTAFRRAGEGSIDASKIFGGEDGKGGLQGMLGDFTRDKSSQFGIDNNYKTGAATAISRGYTADQAGKITGATADIFSQIFGDEEHQEDAGRLAGEMGQSMAEFLSRGLAKGMTFDQAFAALREFAKEAGVTLSSSMANLPKAMDQTTKAAMEFGKVDPFNAAKEGANAFADQLMASTALFQGDYPAGVHLTAIALEEMSKDGVKAFGDLDHTGHDTLLNLTKDGQLTHDTIANLAGQGFSIDTTEFDNRVKDITASATFVGENISQVFTGPSVSAGINAMMAQLKTGIESSINGANIKNLLDQTNIGGAFEGVFGKLRELGADSTLAQNPEFMQDMAAQIAEGKANLQDMVPQLQAMREASEAIDQALEDAFKPSTAEEFWNGMADTLKANQDAIDQMAQSLAGVAIDAERATPGGGAAAARAAVGSSVDNSIYMATKAGAADAYGKDSPQGQQLAALTTQFQYKVAAALQDGVISGEEKADLTALKQKMHDAGNALADGISAGTKQLDELFRGDRLKGFIDEATGQLKGAVGTAGSAFFDAIKGGASTGEAVTAFGKSFKETVQSNVLEGLQQALVQSAMMEGALGTLMGQIKGAVSTALEDGSINEGEQAWIDTLVKGLGGAMDSTTKALEPTLNAMGAIAQDVVGNTDKSADKLKDLNDSAKDTSYGVDEMSRRAAHAMQGVADAVPDATTGAIKDGMTALKDAVGAGSGGTAEAIKDGVGALKDALGGAAGGGADAIKEGIGAMADALGGGDAGLTGQISTGLDALKDAIGGGGGNDELKANLEKLRDAFGPNVDADAMRETLEKLKAGFSPDVGGTIADGLGALKDSLGAGTGGVDMAGAVGAVRDALASGAGGGDSLEGAIGSAIDAMSGSDGLITATEAAVNALAGSGSDGVAGASQSAADALKDSLIGGLDNARTGLDTFADLLRGFKLPIGNSAKGGSFSKGMSFVGEEGMELVVANAGGGFTVIPLNGVPHAADGINVGSNSGPDLIGIRPGGSSRGGSGPFGRPAIPPYAPPPPNRPDDGGSSDGAHRTKIAIAFSFDQAIDDFLRGGSIKDFSVGLQHAAGEGILKGMEESLLKQAGLEAAMKRISGVMRDAMKDGVIDPDELKKIENMGQRAADNVQEAAVAMGPAFSAVAKAFGIDLGDAVDPITEKITDDFGAAFQSTAKRFGLTLGKDTYENLLKGAKAGSDAIGGALHSVLSDPSKLSMGELTKALKGQIYQSVSSGLVDAFIQSAVIQGALAVPMGIIQQAFAAVAAGQKTAAEANVIIGSQVGDILGIINGPDFQAMMKPILDGLGSLAKDLGQTGDAVQETVPPFQEAADAAANACTGECDLQYKLAATQTGIGNLTNAGGAGIFGIEYYQPQHKFARGGFARSRPGGIPGIFAEDGDEVVLPLDSPQTGAALEAAARGFAAVSRGSATSSGGGLSAAIGDMKSEMGAIVETLKDQIAASKDENAKLRAALDDTFNGLANRPQVLEVDGQVVAKTSNAANRRRSRAGSAIMDRTR